MSLQFIIGNAGSGKSTLLYQQIIQESLRRPSQKFLVIVPEQFTMQTQKEFVRLHPSHAIMNIDILSFERLAYRVLMSWAPTRLPCWRRREKISFCAESPESGAMS